MLLPTKGINPERSLLAVGSVILSMIDPSTTVSALWERYTSSNMLAKNQPVISFDWFVLALAMLFTIQAIEWNEKQQLERCHVST